LSEDVSVLRKDQEELAARRKEIEKMVIES
jgi:hypothetical protein